MAKFTRTAYASGRLAALAREIAHQSGITGENGAQFAYDDLHLRAGKGRKRVRITILIEPEPAPPKRERGPKRPRPVQALLPLPEVSTFIPIDTSHPAYRKHFGTDGGAT